MNLILTAVLTLASLSPLVASAQNCIQVEGEYVLKGKKATDDVHLYVEQKGCDQVNVVYDYAETGKEARTMLFDGRPVVYEDSLEMSYTESYEITGDRILVHATGIRKPTQLKPSAEMHTETEIQLDSARNWVEKGFSYIGTDASAANHFESTFIRTK